MLKKILLLTLFVRKKIFVIVTNCTVTNIFIEINFRRPVNISLIKNRISYHNQSFEVSSYVQPSSNGGVTALSQLYFCDLWPSSQSMTISRLLCYNSKSKDSLISQTLKVEEKKVSLIFFYLRHKSLDMTISFFDARVVRFKLSQTLKIEEKKVLLIY